MRHHGDTYKSRILKVRVFKNYNLICAEEKKEGHQILVDIRQRGRDSTTQGYVIKTGRS